MSRFWALSVSGFAATAISFGPARVGFGLFVPEFSAAFSLSTSSVGIISSLGFIGYFIGLLIAQTLLARRGPELSVVAGLMLSTAGLFVVAVAPNTAILAGGVFLATSSAGFTWTPFNAAVHRSVSDWWRPAALSAISTGTSIGIVGTGLAAFAMFGLGFSWRVCWVLFAFASAFTLAVNLWGLRDLQRAPAAPWGAWPALVHWGAAPLFAIGFVTGTTSAIYIAFAADRVVTVGGLRGLPIEVVPAVIYVCCGLLGFTGLLTARAKETVGLSVLLRILMLAGAGSLALVALAPGNWVGMVASAGLQGIHIMMTSAVLAFWSERLYPTLPSLSLTAALLAMATGSSVGPATAGLVSDAAGAETMFLGAAILPALLAVALRDRHVQERPRKPRLSRSDT